jgi:hypothetical protein
VPEITFPSLNELFLSLVQNNEVLTAVFYVFRFMFSIFNRFRKNYFSAVAIAGVTIGVFGLGTNIPDFSPPSILPSLKLSLIQ